ncbi:TerC/Alx family metal homeostasis membrane protein [Catenuloplanes atrovinosus]|uniref:TerC family integral membrane protein n=1 Tax=Catenuloplanes atrovinosus TaxID=137266 RepID=A0AAE4CE22_9ACTN|nr:TerC/Alx family metal homeostasis membrane protein [Catenuloplanes atrovinosus]MDR7281067.1 TerC family integral membrane protein [Catenuloplanes atrovinosus]
MHALDSIASPGLWAATIIGLLALLAVDVWLTRRPHEVAMGEALRWTAFYLALPFVFFGFLWWVYGGTPAIEFLTGFVVEKSLSVDNLFVFMLLLASFAVPPALSQRVLLYGIVGALLLRAVFIALGAGALATGTCVFLLFGAVLVWTAVRVLREAGQGPEATIDVDDMRTVRMLRRWLPVTKDYDGFKLVTRVDGRRALTPAALVVTAIFMTDIVFAVDSVPAVYGVTEDPYLVLATNAFALLGLRALYFVLHDALGRLRHLNYGLGVILAFIGVKLVLHWAHGSWSWVPEVPTTLSLAVIVLVLATVTATSLWTSRRVERRSDRGGRPGVSGEPADQRGDLVGHLVQGGEPGRGARVGAHGAGDQRRDLP